MTKAGLAIVFLAASLSHRAALAQTSLSTGELTVLGVTADTNDSFAFVPWVNLASGTVLRFTDHSFTNATTGVNGTENDMVITLNQAVTAGSVIRWENTVGATLNGVAFTTAPTISGALSGISSDGDQVFAYQGTAIGSGTSASGRTLLYGFNVANTSWISTGTATSNASYLPSALSAATSNFDSGNFDNAGYTGTRTGLTTAFYRAAISSVTNYTQNDTRFDLATTGFTLDSAATVFWDANGSTAGTGGTGTWNTSTLDRFQNGSGTITYFPWVNSDASNSHTAVFAGTAGTVTVAAGGVTASGLQFDVDGYTVTGSPVTLLGAAPSISVVTLGHAATISSEIAGTTGLTKSGAGTLVLSAASTYTGDTTVSAGTLTLGTTGSIATSSSVSISSGATLQVEGNLTTSVPGTLTGTGTLAANGTISPAGAGPTGAVNFTTGALQLGSASTTNLDVTSVSFDEINTGSIAYDGTLNVSFASTFTLPQQFDLFDGTASGTFDVVNVLGSYSAILTALNSWTATDGGTILSFDHGTGILSLTAAAIPEPLTAAGVLLLAGRVLGRRGRASL